MNCRPLGLILFFVIAGLILYYYYGFIMMTSKIPQTQRLTLTSRVIQRTRRLPPSSDNSTTNDKDGDKKDTENKDSHRTRRQQSTEPQKKDEIEIPVSSNPFHPKFDCTGLDSNRIIGGRDAIPHSYPWIAYVITKIPKKGRQRCAGTAISDRWVVSAAHCFRRGDLRASTAWIYLGVHDITDMMSERALVFQVYPGDIYFHKSFDSRLLRNDIVLIRLPIRIPNHPNIKPACLPLDGKDPELGEPVIAAGWGLMMVKPELRATKLQYIKQYIVACNKPHKKNICCIKDVNVIRNLDSCRGDSGGPLIWTQGSLHKFVGILSYGSDECDGDHSRIPTFYIRVTDQLEWMKCVITNETTHAEKPDDKDIDRFFASGATSSVLSAPFGNCLAKLVVVMPSCLAAILLTITLLIA